METLTYTFAPRPEQFLDIAHQFLQLLCALRQQSLYHSAKIIANVTTAPHTTILNSIFASDLRFLHLGVEFILFLWYNEVEIERRNAKLKHKKKTTRRTYANRQQSNRIDDRGKPKLQQGCTPSGGQRMRGHIQKQQAEICNNRHRGNAPVDCNVRRPHRQSRQARNFTCKMAVMLTKKIQNVQKIRIRMRIFCYLN